MAGDYRQVAEAVADRVRPEMTDWQRMQVVVDALWEAFGAPSGRVSWVGFYLPNESGERLFLGPRRDKPASSPTGLGGVCGRAYLDREPVVVQDVRSLGKDYVACDPRDRSELAVPLAEGDERCRGVLDLDSHELAAFDTSDVTGLRRILAAAGLR